MQIRVFLACLLLLLPGCFADEEGPDFNGKDLGKMDVYKFTLSDQNQSQYSLENLEGQVVVLAFVYTRCDDVCLLIANNLKVVKANLTQTRSGFSYRAAMLWNKLPPAMRICIEAFDFAAPAGAFFIAF